KICPPSCCDMRGLLSFMVLWLLRKKSMYGEEIATELEKMKGNKPSPGTIYPALKQLQGNCLIISHKEGSKVIYSLTDKGRTAVNEAIDYFINAFGCILNESRKE
ncbi:MAG: PadR family transcriptional regulator, partial [ANME-2 cluster archaeon]|nr:PadR family transcriptional regulator [ANME-2 cluster archaeon]